MRPVRTDAKRSLVFEITADDVKEAKRFDKTHCVIACAVASLPGINGISVGSSIVHVKTSAGIRRYATPLVMKRALAAFDASGKWNLPVGVYHLNPVPQSLSQEKVRHHHASQPRSINPKTGKPYKKTGAQRLRQVNARVLEFAKIKKAARAAA